MKTYVRINYLISIIGVILIIIYCSKIPDKIGFSICFLVCQHFSINFLGLLMVNDDLFVENWEIIANDIITIYKESINIIKFYLNL